MSDCSPTTHLLPQPREIANLGGKVALANFHTIQAEENFRAIAELLANRLRTGTGLTLPVTPISAAGPAIVFRQAPQDAGNEAFTLEVSETSATITAAHPGGAYYGSQTFLQLLPPAVFNDAPIPEAVWDLPRVRITDWPEFRWRGVMLDSVRHFQPIAYIKKFIDVLSQHKINVLHWHLTDDQGWRVEIKKYPKLTEIGSHRPESPIGHQVSEAGGDGVPVEGVYTQDEIRELIAYASLRNVHILPEIEMPGHAQAAVAAYPELGCHTHPKGVSTQWGIHETLFNIRPETTAFLQDVLTEIADLFPFDYVHVGGDEAVKNQWINDADTQQRMRDLGVPDEHHLQSWFIRQMAEFLQTRGKKLIGWDEILEGGLPESATVMSWRGEEGALEAAAAGHDAVMCNHKAYYLDYAQNADPLTEPLSIGKCNSLQKVYEASPIPASLTAEQAARIIGVQGQLWTEYIATTSHLEYMAFPRVCALAETGWSDPASRDFDSFLERLAVHVRRLDCQHVRYRSGFSRDAH